MKKVLLALSVCMSLTTFAQVLDVKSISKIDIAESSENVIAGISPTGEYLLLTSASNNGLAKYDLATGETTMITDAQGAGFNAQISSDGNTVIYRETSYTSKKLRQNALKYTNLVTGETRTLIKPTRNLQTFYLDNNSVVAVDNNKLQVKSIGPKQSLSSKPTLFIKDTQLMISDDNGVRNLSPNGTQFSYLWPSVSPDGSKILYYVAGVGAFVCNLDGSNIQSLGIIRAAKWYNDKVIVGMHDEDNGEIITSSQIVASTLDGTKQVLTDNSTIAMYPYTAGSDKIVFSTPQGDAYIINLNVK